jgi:hypothetical protein
MTAASASPSTPVQPEPQTIDMTWIYGTPAPTLSDTNNNTTQITPMLTNETTSSAIMNSTNADSYTLNGSGVMPDTVSRKHGGLFDNWMALTLITIPAIMAALVVIVQFVRKIE